MNISSPNRQSEVYRKFEELINQKVDSAIIWMNEHNIEYIWNYEVGNHIYRLYIPDKDLLLDFEYYPVRAFEYSYIRVNYDTDMVCLMESIFPKTVLKTEDLTVWKLNRKSCNHFLRENNAAPIYDKSVLRLAWVKDTTIYQCIVIKENKIIANVTRRHCSVEFGTFMLLRYLIEKFGFSEILFKINLDRPNMAMPYQFLNLSYVQNHKKKIWWSPEGTRWKIKKELTSQFVPFYFCETRLYRYPN